MRRVGVMDLYHAARAVAAVEPEQRAIFARTLCLRAHVADKYVKKLRKSHPLWGDGSLRGAAMAHSQVPAEASISTLLHEYIDILQCIGSRR